MNIDEMKEEEKGVSEPENTTGPDATAMTGEKEPVDTGAEEKEPDAKEEAAGPVREVLKPGAQLAAYRIAAGIDQEQVATSLKMTVRQVRELEADNYEVLHGVAISRGFIRAYAKMLQVDPEPLVAMFKTEEPARPLTPPPGRGASGPFMQSSQSFGKKRRIGKTGKIVLAVVVLVLLYGIYSMKWFSGGSFSFRKKAEPVADITKQEKSKSVSTEIEIPKAAVTGPEKAPALTEEPAAKNEQQQDNQAPKEEPSVSAAGPASLEAKKQDTSSASQDKPEKTGETQQEKTGKAAPAVSQNLLVLGFSGPSRVQLLKADGAVLREFEGKAGDVQRLEMSEPVTLIVERAANVQVTFRELPLVLKAARRSPEARVELK